MTSPQHKAEGHDPWNF